MSLIVNRKMKYLIAMSRIIIFTITVYDISNWAIVVGRPVIWGGEAPLENRKILPPLEKCVGYSLKLLDIV